MKIERVEAQVIEEMVAIMKKILSINIYFSLLLLEVSQKKIFFNQFCVIFFSRSLYF